MPLLPRRLQGQAHLSCSWSPAECYSTAFQFQSWNLELRVSRCGRFVSIERCFHSVFKGILIQSGVSLETWLTCSKHSPCLILRGRLPNKVRGLLGGNFLSGLQWLGGPRFGCAYFTFSWGQAIAGGELGLLGDGERKCGVLHFTRGARKRQGPPGCPPHPQILWEAVPARGIQELGSQSTPSVPFQLWPPLPLATSLVGCTFPTEETLPGHEKNIWIVLFILFIVYLKNKN